MRTYILFCDNSLEFYCGKTNDMTKRMFEHHKGIGWFKFKNRKKFRVIVELYGDYEKEIKRFGVEKFFRMIQNQDIQYKKVSLS